MCIRDRNIADDVLEPTKQAVLRMNEQLDKAGIANKDAALGQRWFKPVKTPKGTHYEPLEKRGGHKQYFDRYWGERRAEFDELIGLIKPMTTEQAEIVATLYMAWNDFCIRGERVDDDIVVAEVLNNWDQSKRRISEDRWRKAIGWMQEKGVVPRGFGSETTRAPGSGRTEDGH